jgi:hypothetical protein
MAWLHAAVGGVTCAKLAWYVRRDGRKLFVDNRLFVIVVIIQFYAMTHTGLFFRFSSLVVSSVMLVVASGCAPRGESHTVEQILADARSAYQSVATSAPAETGAALKFLATSLDRIAGLGGGGEAKVISQEIAAMLSELSPKAGYTVRPAMAELVNQYRTIAGNNDSALSIGAPNLKLLAARTYALVTSELKTTQFKVA